MAMIDTDTLTFRQFVSLFPIFIEKCKAGEDERSISALVLKTENRKTARIELIHDLDGNVIQKRRDEYSPYYGYQGGFSIIQKVYNEDGIISATEIGTNNQATEVEYVTARYFEAVSTQAGRITPDEGVKIVLDLWPNGVDAVVCGIKESGTGEGGEPNGEPALGVGGDELTTSLDTSGNFVLSDRPANPPVALIYIGEKRIIDDAITTSL